jgi:hypothetical protein
MFVASKVEIRPKAIELSRFGAMHEERRKACIKAVFRFFVFKGIILTHIVDKIYAPNLNGYEPITYILYIATKKEHVNRTAIGEILGQIDPDCKKHISVVLSHVQPKLLKLTGYQIIPGDAIKGFTKGKRDDFYIVNTLLIPSPTVSEAEVAGLRNILQDGTSATELAFQGFKFILFHLIFSGNGQRTTLSEIVRQLNKLDSRFPRTINSNQLLRGNGARDSLASIPELGENVMDMLERLRREEYIAVSKDEVDAADVMRNIYEFGPRFYLEVHFVKPIIIYI